jgi:hypothetical protein
MMRPLTACVVVSPSRFRIYALDNGTYAKEKRYGSCAAHSRPLSSRDAKQKQYSKTQMIRSSK